MTKMKVADYLAKRVSEAGIRDVFMLTGGGAMHLNDALGRHPGLRTTFFHHEQACSLAADAYYRIHNRLPLVNVTTGPGGTNALTGVYGAYVDSIAMFVVSGQVKWETMVRSTGLPLRQLGDQEVDIISMARPVTKYAEVVEDPLRIRYHIERALHLALSGRPGPVWLDIPMNVQGAYVDVDALPGYSPEEDTIHFETDLEQACAQLFERLTRAQRPVILAGNGVWLSGEHERFLRLLDKLRIPATTAWNANDLVSNANPWYVGRPGTIGDRAGNFAVQNADFLLVLGSRLNIRMVSYNWKAFARAAYKVIVDIDPVELQKPTLAPDMQIHADLRVLLPRLLEHTHTPAPAHADWLEWCQQRRRAYPVVLPEYWDSPAINHYCFAQALSEELDEGEIVVTADGAAAVTTFQAAIMKKGQRYFHNSGSAPMGFDLPAAIGACRASDAKRIICLAGDGSIQLNIQELQTIVGNRLPIKIFVLNNQGYLSIRQTQDSYFGSHYVGCGASSGVTFPHFSKLAPAYGLPYLACREHGEMRDVIRACLDQDGPVLCEVFLDPNMGFAPKLASRQLDDGRIVSPALEDMHPFLTREELLNNLLITPLEA